MVKDYFFQPRQTACRHLSMKAFTPSTMYSESYLLFTMKHDIVRGVFWQTYHMHQYVKFTAFSSLNLPDWRHLIKMQKWTIWSYMWSCDKVLPIGKCMNFPVQFLGCILQKKKHAWPLQWPLPMGHNVDILTVAGMLILSSEMQTLDWEWHSNKMEGVWVSVDCGTS